MTDAPPPERTSAGGNPGLALGAILVVAGLILFAGQVVDVGIGDLGWPFWIAAAGAAILLVGLLARGLLQGMREPIGGDS